MKRLKCSIVLDRVLVFDQQEQKHYLLTDPADIKSSVNKHFQTIANIPQPSQTVIPDSWIKDYEPMSHIDDDIYIHILDKISDEEWSKTISDLPNNKASGPSNISYEMLKHLGSQTAEMLRNLINCCFKLNTMPKEWKSANIYPIPKPHEFESKLNNTLQWLFAMSNFI